MCITHRKSELKCHFLTSFSQCSLNGWRASVEAKLTVVSNEHIKHWVPTVKEAQGQSFIEIFQWNSKFVSLCIGEALKFGGDRNMFRTVFYDELTKARTRASQEAFDSMQQQLRDAEPEGGWRWRVVGSRAIRPADALVCGEVVEVRTWHKHESMAMEMMFGVKATPAWVEATASNLAFIQKAMKEEFDAANEGRAAGRFKRQRPRGQQGSRGGDGGEDVEDDDDHDDDGDDNKDV